MMPILIINMNANSTFWIGSEHTVCEDYALAKVNAGLAYAIVSDGCSASPDVDLGARAMVMSAERALRLSTEYTPEKFGEITIRNAQRLFDVFPHLHPQALDATLLVAWVEDKKLRVYAYGDGVIYIKNKGIISTIHINLTSGAPDYLSYTLNAERQSAYENVADNKKQISVTVDGKTIQTDHKPLQPYFTEMPVEDGDIIAVISDGVNSFRETDNTIIDWKDALKDVTDFRTTHGEFVLRTISALKRKCLKEGRTHYDDLSIGVIVV